MIIYLVQSGDSLDGSDGYSYGLLHGGQTRLLVRFVDFMKTQRPTIHRDPKSLNRRKLTKRAKESK